MIPSKVYHPFLFLFCLFSKIFGKEKPCSSDHYRYGKWVHGANLCGLNSTYTPTDFNNNLAPLSIRYDIGNWCWQPQGCYSEPFNKPLFCKLIGGRKVLVVGDSINFEFYEAASKQLGMQYFQPSQFNEVHDKDIHDASSKLGSICENMGGGRLVYIRNDFLDLSDGVCKGRGDCGGDFAVRNWKKFAHYFDILIMNKGAHFVHYEKAYKMTVDLANFLKTLIEDQPHIKVIYRTASPGHVNATLLSKPITAELTMPIYNMLLYSNDTSVEKYVSYHYISFAMSNDLVISILRQFVGKNLLVMNVAELTYLRPDGHRCKSNNDCGDPLHYYLPSVIDNYLVVLQNVLLSS